MWNKLKKLRPELLTPCYVYDFDKVRANARSFMQIAPARVGVSYATMANPRPEVLNATKAAGLGAFVNSRSHLDVVLNAGVDTREVVFAGSGHSEALLADVANAGVWYCADSPSQLQEYLRHAPSGRIGLRVNLASLLDGKLTSDPAPRLGMTVEEVKSCAKSCPVIQMLHVYVGTNLKSPGVYLDAIRGLTALARACGQIREIDLGGGFALAPADAERPSMWETILGAWERELDRNGNAVTLRIEPGRSVVRTAGTLYVTVTDVKTRGAERYILVDSSSTWYPRRLVHGAEDHTVKAAGLPENAPSIGIANICGSTTFSGDILARVELPAVRIGDVLEFRNAGAYCESMNLAFLGIPAPEVWGLDAGELSRLPALRQAVPQENQDLAGFGGEITVMASAR